MKTGNMLRNVASIDLKLPIAEIKKQIDGFATSPDVAGLLKMDLVMDDNGLRWYNNLEAIVHNYPKIGAFDL